MIGRLNHIAIVVADLDEATARWRDVLGAEVSEPQVLDHGVTVVLSTAATARSNCLNL